MRHDQSATNHDADQLSMLDTEPAPPKKTKPSKRCPPDFEITAELRAWAKEKAPDVDIGEETDALKDYEFHAARSDWNGVWRNWMRKEQKAVLRFKPRNQKQPERRFQSADEIEDALIERAITKGLDDGQIVSIEELAIAPNLRARIAAKRLELQPTEH